MNKNFKIFGVRQSLLGDMIGALTVLNHLEKLYPNSYKYWHLARKCAHVAPILLEHPLIDKIIFTDCEEGFGPKDRDIMNSCDLVINTMPQHPLEQDWPNFRNFYEETFIMSGFSLADYNNLSPTEKYPQLKQWFRPEPRLGNAKYISCWPFAGYAKEPKRSPSVKWYEQLCLLLFKEGIHFVQYGHPNDPVLFDYDVPEGADCTFYYRRRNHKDFFQQIRETLSSDCVVSTDSGSGLIFAAYNFPQVGLINRHWPGQHCNPLALAPIGKNTYNFSGVADSISVEEVFEKIKEFIK